MSTRQQEIIGREFRLIRLEESFVRETLRQQLKVGQVSALFVCLSVRQEKRIVLNAISRHLAMQQSRVSFIGRGNASTQCIIQANEGRSKASQDFSFQLALVSNAITRMQCIYKKRKSVYIAIQLLP